MAQSIQEYTKWNLWKTAFKNFHLVHSWMLCPICDALRDLIPFVKILKNVKNSHGGVLLLIKLLALACNITYSNTPPREFFMFLKFYKWYQIAKRVPCESVVFTRIKECKVCRKKNFESELTLRYVILRYCCTRKCFLSLLKLNVMFI